MSDLKDHDPNEGEWISPFDLLVGKIEMKHGPTHLEDLILFLEERAAQVDDNPNIVRGYN